jgi:hypothetical protein
MPGGSYDENARDTNIPVKNVPLHTHHPEAITPGFELDRIKYLLPRDGVQTASLDIRHNQLSGINTGINFNYTTNAVTNPTTLGYLNATLPNRIMEFTARFEFRSGRN